MTKIPLVLLLVSVAFAAKLPDSRVQIRDLMEKARLGDFRAVDDLIKIGYKASIGDEPYGRVLEAAASGPMIGNPKTAEYVKILDLLKGKFKNVDLRTQHLNRTPLHLAVTWGQVAQAEWLLKNGANPNLLDARKGTVAHQASGMGGHFVCKDLLELLRNYKADFTLTDDTGVSVYGRFKRVRDDLKQSFEINAEMMKTSKWDQRKLETETMKQESRKLSIASLEGCVKLLESWGLK